MKYSLIVLLSLISIGFITAQSDTLEENYLEDNQVKKQIQMEVLRHQAASEELEQKEKSLKGIEKILGDSNFTLTGNDRKEIAEILGEIGLLGTGIVTFQGGGNLMNIWEVRRESARLLGELGQNEAARILMKMLRIDPSAEVLGQCAVSTAKVIPTMDLEEMPGGDYQMVLILAETMKSQNIRDDAGQYALGFLDALLLVSSHEPALLNDSMVIGELTKLTETGSGYNSLVRDRAEYVIEQIQSF